MAMVAPAAEVARNLRRDQPSLFILFIMDISSLESPKRSKQNMYSLFSYTAKGKFTTRSGCDVIDDHTSPHQVGEPFGAVEGTGCVEFTFDDRALRKVFLRKGFGCKDVHGPLFANQATCSLQP